jgi:hypothetical protein
MEPNFPPAFLLSKHSPTPTASLTQGVADGFTVFENRRVSAGCQYFFGRFLFFKGTYSIDIIVLLQYS